MVEWTGKWLYKTHIAFLPCVKPLSDGRSQYKITKPAVPNIH